MAQPDAECAPQQGVATLPRIAVRRPRAQRAQLVVPQPAGKGARGEGEGAGARQVSRDPSPPSAADRHALPVALGELEPLAVDLLPHALAHLVHHRHPLRLEGGGRLPFGGGGGGSGGLSGGGGGPAGSSLLDSGDGLLGGGGCRRVLVGPRLGVR